MKEFELLIGFESRECGVCSEVKRIMWKGVMPRPRCYMGPCFWRMCWPWDKFELFDNVLGTSQVPQHRRAPGYWSCYIEFWCKWIVCGLWMVWMALRATYAHWLMGCCLNLLIFIYYMTIWLDNGPCMSGNLLDPLCTKLRRTYHEREFVRSSVVWIYWWTCHAREFVRPFHNVDWLMNPSREGNF